MTIANPSAMRNKAPGFFQLSFQQKTADLLLVSSLPQPGVTYKGV